MGVHIKPQTSPVPASASPPFMREAVAHDGGYRSVRWSPLSLGLTLLVQALPILIGLWVWHPAVVQMAPATPLAVFDVAAPETPAPDPIPPPEKPVETPAQPSPATQPTEMETPPVQSMVTMAAAVTTPTKVVPPPQQPAPPPRPISPSASQKPADWQSLVLGRLNAVKAYPASARARRQQGVAMIRFTLDRKGVVLHVALAQSSGFALLDREAIALPKRATPLPPPPDDVTGDRIELIVPVEFHF